MLRQPILDGIRQYEPELVAIRQDIHRHPETRFEETRTAALVASKLREWGIAVEEGIGKTGVVGTLKGKRPGQRAVGLRADMDALFIEEENTFAHASTVPGKMHACGHDGHTTMLLGAARYLAENPDFAGTVHFIFQPAEEAGTGAAAMIADGLFDRFPVDAVYGMHNTPGMPVGQFATRPGPILAGADFWGVTFTGTGGHGGAAPHLATDATVVLGHFLLGVQTILPRNLKPTESAALSVGHVSGGTYGSPNVMPSRVVVRGTARYFRTEAQAIIRQRLQDLATTLATAYGCQAELTYEPLCPPPSTSRPRYRWPRRPPWRWSAPRRWASSR
jgi:amidohydrolase